MSKITKQHLLSNLCYYDKRNPDGFYSLDWNTDEDLITTNNCHCDNCFYGRTELAEELLKYIKE